MYWCNNSTPLLCRANAFCRSKWCRLNIIVQFCHDFTSWKCLTVSVPRFKCLQRRQTSSRYKVLFSFLFSVHCWKVQCHCFAPHFRHHSHTQQSSESNHSCLTGSTPCFPLTFPQGYLAYSWPLIPTEKHIEKEMKLTEGKKMKSLSLISYQQATMGWVNEQILNCFNMSSSGALQLRFQCVWLTEQQILNIIESLQRPGRRGFEIWYSWWKLRWKLGGKCLKCFKSLGQNESGFIRSPKHFHGNQRKRPWTEIKASQEDHRTSPRAELSNTFHKADTHF